MVVWRERRDKGRFVDSFCCEQRVVVVNRFLQWISSFEDRTLWRTSPVGDDNHAGRIQRVPELSVEEHKETRKELEPEDHLFSRSGANSRWSSPRKKNSVKRMRRLLQI